MSMIYLVRHGQTEFNAAGRWQGQVDSPLTSLGLTQAALVAELLYTFVKNNDVAIFSSPLGRAYTTATIIADKLNKRDNIIVDSRLMEIGMGAWDGLTDFEIESEWPNARNGLERDEWFFHSPDGETYEIMSKRVGTALNDIKNHSAQTKIIVSHGVTGKILRGLYSSLSKEDALKLDVPHDAIFRLSASGYIERLDCKADKENQLK